MDRDEAPMTIDQFKRHLIRMNDLYQSACHAFADGEISTDEARRRVRQISFTDRDGRTWRIETAQSGHVATFTDGNVVVTLDQPAPDPESDDLVDAGVADDADGYSFAEVRRRLTPMLAALGLTAALVAVPIGYVVFHDRSTSNANSEPSAPSFDIVTLSTAVNTSVNAPVTTDEPVTTPAPTVSTTTNADAPAVITTDDKTVDEIPFETEVIFGESVLGRPLIVERRGEAGGARVLVVGVIHGNEQAGLHVIDLLRSMDLDEGIDLWLVPMVNPDGVAANERQNANGVDLNRNFPRNWQAIGKPGYWEYAGESAASEPEVTATMALAELIVPDFVVWFHQDYFRISPSTGRAGEIRARYAELVDLPLVTITGGTYTGTAGNWVGTVLAPSGASLLVEFGAELRPGEAQANAEAILTIVKEFFAGGHG